MIVFQERPAFLFAIAFAIGLVLILSPLPVRGSSGNANATVAYSVAANTSTSPRTGRMTIAGHPFTLTQAQALSVSITDAGVKEGNAGTTNAVFTVSLSPASDQSVTVEWVTDPNTAGAVVDYVPGAGTLIFQPGQTTATITVAVNGDTTPESNESFFIYVAIRDATNATIANSEGLGTIIEDDFRDFNGDGKADILFRHPTSGEVYLWMMNGKSIVSQGSIQTVNPAWMIQDVGDFNGDGKRDIFWRHRDGTISIWLMDGVNILARSDTQAVDTAWQIGGFEDFNGDGKTDVFWRHTDGRNLIWLIEGLNIFIDDRTQAVDRAWQIEGFGDFNGDGKTDVLWRRPDGRILIWLMSGGNILAQGEIQSTVVNGGGSTMWRIRRFMDFNGDGKTDVLWERPTDGVALIWLMDGLNVLAHFGPGKPGPASWRIRGFGDFNGDGKTDLFWRDNNGTTTLWLMDGLNILARGSAQVVGIAWQIEGFEDFNGDGKTDVLWRHTDGTVAVWLIDGLTISDSGSPGSRGGHVIVYP